MEPSIFPTPTTSPMAPPASPTGATIKIRNKRTGEVKEIPVNQAQDFGLNPAQVLERFQAQQSLQRVSQGKPAEEPKDELAVKKKTALAVVSQLEKLYGRGASENVGTEGDLSLSPGSTTFEKVRGKASAVGKKMFDSSFQEDLNIYKSALQGVVGVFSQAFGSGTPQEAEALRFMYSAPNATSTGTEAKEWFNNVKAFLGQSQASSTGLSDTPPNLEDPNALPSFDNAPPDLTEMATFDDALPPTPPNLVDWGESLGLPQSWTSS